MKKIIVIIASATGKTQAIAEAIVEGLSQFPVKIETKDCFSVEPPELHDYDGILIGTYTWEGVVPDEFMDFYEELDYEDLTGKVAAVFGSGDSYYGDTYGAALESFRKKLIELGANVSLPNFLVELYPEEKDVEAAKEFAEKFVAQLLENNK